MFGGTVFGDTVKPAPKTSSKDTPPRSIPPAACGIAPALLGDLGGVAAEYLSSPVARDVVQSAMFGSAREKIGYPARGNHLMI